MLYKLEYGYSIGNESHTFTQYPYLYPQAVMVYIQYYPISSVILGGKTWYCGSKEIVSIGENIKSKLLEEESFVSEVGYRMTL